MSWHEKSRPMEFDSKPIEGLFYLDGDRVATTLESQWTKGEKYPVIVFPFGVSLAIWESGNPDIMGIIHFFGEMDLVYNQSRDEAQKWATKIAEVIGYGVKSIGDDQLEVWGFEDNEHYLITYDNDNKQMVDVTPITEPPGEAAVHPGHVLMTEEIRESLPPLYANEDKGLEAIAPVKYFHANGWTWYASEYDPDKKLFFGLVDGFELELGYFTLEELQEIGKDGRTLPIERDLHYQPKTIKELQDLHRKMRGQG